VPRKDGSTEREHLKAAASRSAAARDALKPLPVPEGTQHILAWFQELSACRGMNGFGFEPIGWQDIDAWSRLRGIRPTRFELQALQALDAAFFRVRAK
jgi:hypothetical protein